MTVTLKTAISQKTKSRKAENCMLCLLYWKASSLSISEVLGWTMRNWKNERTKS